MLVSNAITINYNYKAYFKHRASALPCRDILLWHGSGTTSEVNINLHDSETNAVLRSCQMMLNSGGQCFASRSMLHWLT